MIRLDHFVINIDNKMDKLNSLKKQIAPLGFPFEPSWGKGTKGFKVANIWIGLQYLELLWLKREDGGGWKENWIKKYNSGHRGIIGIGLLTNELDRLIADLQSKGVPISDPERICFKWFFGLFRKTMPWRSVYISPIPGTDLQLFIGELDNEKVMKQMKGFMVPNAEENGINGIKEAIIKYNFSQEAWEFIRILFPYQGDIGSQVTYELENTKLTFQQKSKVELVKVQLKAISDNAKLKGNSFAIENVTITI